MKVPTTLKEKQSTAVRERANGPRTEAREGRNSRQGGKMIIGHRYIVYDLVVESEVQLTSVKQASDRDGDPAISIVLAPAEYFREKAGTVAPDGEPIHHVVLSDGSIYIRVDGIFETIVSRDGRRAVCVRLSPADERSFEANLLTFVMSTALTLQGEELLHGTVVGIEDGAIGLLGPSGVGKSTLAAYLIGQGGELITDDMVRLIFTDGTALACPGPYRLKLFEEPAARFLPEALAHGSFNVLSGKVMVQPTRSIRSLRQPRRLAALFWLGDPEPTAPRLSLRRIVGTELARTLVASTMNIRNHTTPRLLRQFRFAEQVAKALPMYALRYSRNFEVMERVAEEINRAVRS